MNMFNNIDFKYCEYNTNFILNQPLNVISNLIFVIVALWVWRDSKFKLSRFGLVFIAIGSIVWHASHLTIGLVLDISSIAIFAILLALDFCRHLHKKPTLALSLILPGLVISGLIGKLLEPWMPMLSGAFIPAVLFFVYCGVKLREEALFFSSALIMTVAIAAREMDLAMCPYISCGTHFLWHLGTGLSLVPVYVVFKKQKAA